MNANRQWVEGQPRFLALAGLVLVLAGCQSTSPSALQVMREQQQLQAQAQMADEDAERARAPSQPELMLSMIRQTQAQGRHFAALAYIDAYVQRFGDRAELRPLRADALRHTGQEQASEQAYRAMIAGGQAAAGWHGLGLLAGAQGAFAQAASHLDQAARRSPADAGILGDLGYARLRAGDLAGARLPLGQAAELDPANTKVVANLALLLLVDGQPERAERVLQQMNASEAMRLQLASLAAQVRSSLVPAAAQPVSAPEPAAMAATAPAPVPPVRSGQGENVPIVRFVAAPQPQAAAMAARPAVAAEVRTTATAGMTTPLMDYLGNTPLVR